MERAISAMKHHSAATEQYAKLFQIVLKEMKGNQNHHAQNVKLDMNWQMEIATVAQETHSVMTDFHAKMDQ